jgi:hypothetical protein
MRARVHHTPRRARLAALAQHLDRVRRISVLRGFAESDSLR